MVRASLPTLPTDGPDEPPASHRLRFLTVFAPGDAEGLSGMDARVWPLDGRHHLLGRDPGEGGIPVLDAKVSRRHARLVFAPQIQVYRIDDLGSRNGTWVDGVRHDKTYLEPESVVRIGHSLLVYSEAEVDPGLADVAPEAGSSLQRALCERRAELAAPTRLPVLICGPTGAGKELLARRVHEVSGRRGMVAVNCATFSRELIASELFGHVRGAFSGAARSRTGLFREASGGTLFLDEVAELPPDQQPALLRVLEEGRVRPVGADREVDVDVRIVSATHQPLEVLVAEGRFREDLLGRLAGLTLHLPGLTSRRAEVLPLFEHFLGEPRRRVGPDAAEALLRHAWPTNVRGLQQAAAAVRLVAGADGPVELAALPEPVRAGQAAADAPPAEPLPPATVPDREALEGALTRHRGNIAEVAREFGRHRPQVYRWMRRYGIEAEAFRGRG